jgi:hypothetical protein
MASTVGFALLFLALILSYFSRTVAFILAGLGAVFVIISMSFNGSKDGD